MEMPPKSEEPPQTDVYSSCKQIKSKSDVLIVRPNYIPLFFFSIKLSGMFPSLAVLDIPSANKHVLSQPSVQDSSASPEDIN